MFDAALSSGGRIVKRAFSRFSGWLTAAVGLLAISVCPAKQADEMLKNDFPELFRIYGAEATGLPAHYVIAIDVSASMKGYADLVTSSIEDFIATLPEGDYVSLLTFGMGAEKAGLPAYLTESNREAVKGFVRQIGFKDQKTDLRGVTSLVLDELNKPDGEKLKFVFIFTDFVDDPPPGSKSPDWKTLAKRFQSEQRRGGVEVFCLKLPLGKDAGKHLPEMREIFPRLQVVPVDRETLGGWFQRRKAEILRDRLRFVVAEDLNRPLAKFSARTRGGAVTLQMEPEESRVPVSAEIMEFRFARNNELMLPAPLPVLLTAESPRAELAEAGEGELVRREVPLDAVEVTGETKLAYADELQRLGIEAARALRESLPLPDPVGLGRFDPNVILGAKIGAGVLTLLVLLGLVNAVRSMLPKPIHGTMEYRLGTFSGKRELTGASFNLASLGISGWKPKKTYLVKNIRGEICLCPQGEEPKPLARNRSFTLDGATFTFKSQI